MGKAMCFGGALAAGCLLAGIAAAAPAWTGVQQQVADTERAFAASMQRRDHAAFGGFLADEAIFMNSQGNLRGKPAIAAAWKRFFDKPDAPFSWEPDQVEVLASGTLASTSGPVYDPGGKLIARFNSIWRLEGPDTWRIVFDGGTDVCECKKAER
jgi:ketosteroid isomerase-like protein